MLVLLLLLQMVAAAPRPSELPSFTAFDCDKPAEINVAKIPIDCQHKSEDLELGNHVNISLWQEASKDFLGIICKIEKTEWMFYCGVWSHQSLVSPGKTMRPEEVSVEACRRIYKEGVWRDKSGKEHQVMGDGTTFANYVEAGSLNYQNNKVSCQGVEVQTEGGERYKGVVKLVDLKVEVRTVLVKVTGQGYEVPEASLTVRAQEVKGGGVERGTKGTLVLDIIPPRKPAGCGLVELGRLTVQASDVRDKGEFLRVLFNRQHKLYLLQRNLTRGGRNCAGDRFWETNLPGIFVKKETTGKDERARTSEVESSLGANLVNHFTELTDFTTAELRLELEHARHRETCLRYLHATRETTVGFRPGHKAGTITEIRGEVATSVTCSPVSVRVRSNEPACYSDMPVKYLGQPKFLEPISRVLKDSSSECPCGQVPAMQSQDDQLFKLDPSLTELADVGERIMKDRIVADTVAEKGVYPAAALEIAQRLLTGRWNEESRLKGGGWNLSQPVWHPSPGQPSWTWENLFVATSWLKWGGKILLGLGSAYLAVQVGMWTAGAVGIWKGVQEGTTSSLATRLRRVMRALVCSQYSEGVLRGGRAGERGSLGDREEEIRGGEPGAFTLGQNV